MLLISDIDIVAPSAAERIRQIARNLAAAWDWPYYMALDYVLIDIDRRICEKSGETFTPNDVSCRLYEAGRGERIE